MMSCRHLCVVVAFIMLAVCTVQTASANQNYSSTNRTALLLPHRMMVSIYNVSSNIELQYGYDVVGKSLTLRLVSRFAAENSSIVVQPGWAGIGLRYRENVRYQTMGPADFVQSYYSALDIPCFAQSYLESQENFFPVAGKRSGRQWDLFGTSLSQNETHLTSEMTFSPVHVNVTNTSSYIELLLALGNRSKIQGTSGCEGAAKHDLFAQRLQLDVGANHSGFTLPPYYHGCHYGDPLALVIPSNATGPRCSICFPGFQGPNCTLPCSCPNGLCANFPNVTDGRCAMCNSGYYGSRCTECTCAPGVSICVDGVNGNGFCVCNSPFGGNTCESCDSTHYGAQCQNRCECQRGLCDNGRLGNGTCRSCTAGSAGRYCNVTCPSCQSGFVCDDGIDGSGECIAASIVPTPIPTVPVAFLRVTMNITMSEFSQSAFVATVANAVGVQNNEVNVAGAFAGSVIVAFSFVNMAQNIVQQKFQLFQNLAAARDPSLSSLNILSVDVVRVGVETTIAPPTPVPNATNETSAPTAPPTGIPPTPAPLLPVPASSTLSTAAIVGIAIGSAVALAIIIALIFCGLRFAGQASTEEDKDDMDPVPTEHAIPRPGQATPRGQGGDEMKERKTAFGGSQELDPSSRPTSASRQRAVGSPPPAQKYAPTGRLDSNGDSIAIDISPQGSGRRGSQPVESVPHDNTRFRRELLDEEDKPPARTTLAEPPSLPPREVTSREALDALGEARPTIPPPHPPMPRRGSATNVAAPPSQTTQNSDSHSNDERERSITDIKRHGYVMRMTEDTPSSVNNSDLDRDSDRSSPQRAHNQSALDPPHESAGRPSSASSASGKKRCKYCGLSFTEAPEICDVEHRLHRVLKEERRLEKKAKKDARRRVAEQIAAEHAELLDSDDD